MPAGSPSVRLWWRILSFTIHSFTKIFSSFAERLKILYCWLLRDTVSIREKVCRVCWQLLSVKCQYQTTLKLYAQRHGNTFNNAHTIDCSRVLKRYDSIHVHVHPILLTHSICSCQVDKINKRRKRKEKPKSLWCRLLPALLIVSAWPG